MISVIMMIVTVNRITTTTKYRNDNNNNSAIIRVGIPLSVITMALFLTALKYYYKNSYDITLNIDNPTNNNNDTPKDNNNPYDQ